MGERGISDASTCSNLNLSLQAMIGRQIVWSISTITATMVNTPQTMARVSPALAAVCKYEPRPGRRKSRLPRTNISHAIKKNQPPATDIMEFQMSPIAACGNSNCQNCCHQLNRYASAASRISVGILFRSEPAAGHGHHGIPNESNRGLRQLQLPKLLPPAQSIRQRRFPHFSGDTLPI